MTQIAQEWEVEPRAVDFEIDGYRCAMRRGPAGHWCGYIGIPESHPFYGKSYDAKVGGKLPEATVDEIGAVNLFCASPDDIENPTMVLVVPCHGGLTYADKGKHIEPDSPLWWIGFDCAHAGDMTPKCPSLLGGETYRNVSYVKESLAKAVKAVRIYEATGAA